MSYDDYDPDYIGGQLLDQDNTNQSIQNAYDTYGKPAVKEIVAEAVSDFCKWVAKKSGLSKPKRKIIKKVAKGVTKFVGYYFGWW